MIFSFGMEWQIPVMRYGTSIRNDLLFLVMAIINENGMDNTMEEDINWQELGIGVFGTVRLAVRGVFWVQDMDWIG